MSASAFISEDGVWSLATAGHYFEEVRSFRKSHPTRRFTFWMANSFGSDKESDFSFRYILTSHGRTTYTTKLRASISVCCSLIRILALLEKGNRVPVHESHWKNWSARSFFRFTMVGIPHEFLVPKPNSLNMKAAMLPLRIVENPPDALKHHVHPMLYEKNCRSRRHF